MWMIEYLLYAAGFMVVHQSISHVYATRHAKRAIEIFEEALYRIQTIPEPKGDIMYYVQEVKAERRNAIYEKIIGKPRPKKLPESI
jgi:hypothetical protein